MLTTFKVSGTIWLATLFLGLIGLGLYALSEVSFLVALVSGAVLLWRRVARHVRQSSHRS